MKTGAGYVQGIRIVCDFGPELVLEEAKGKS